MGRRKGGTLKKEEMSQPKLNKHEPEGLNNKYDILQTTAIHPLYLSLWHFITISVSVPSLLHRKTPDS